MLTLSSSIHVCSLCVAALGAQVRVSIGQFSTGTGTKPAGGNTLGLPKLWHRGTELRPAGPPAQDVRTLALLLGLVKTRLDVFHRGTEQSHLVVNEMRGTWVQTFISTPIHPTTIPHPPMCVPEMLFLLLRGRTPFPLATSSVNGARIV